MRDQPDARSTAAMLEGQVMDHYTEWCTRNAVTHGHCTADPPCEHPQPFALPEFGLVCGRCWAYGAITVMEPCQCRNAFMLEGLT